MKIKNTELKVIQGDLTSLKVDAIVNAANNELVMGGGVAGIIRNKGGQEIEAEAVKKGPIDIGGSVVTSAGKLPAKHVIHAATMGMDFKTDQNKVRAAAASAFVCAEELKLSSIAFPALGCGVGGFPKKGTAKIMAQEVSSYLRQPEVSLKEIIFCLYDQPTFDIFNDIVIGYLTYMQEKLGPGPYVTTDVIIEVPEGVVVIERSNPPYGWALPGGFLDYGESLEEAVVREAKEETNLDLVDLKQFHTYSKMGRDPRFQTITTVYTAKGKGIPQAGDDAQNFKIVKHEDLLMFDYAFDHKEIIREYLKKND